MTQSDPSERPSAEEALQQWRAIRGRMKFLHRFWSIRYRASPLLCTPLLDIIHALASIPRFARLLGGGLRCIC